MNYVGRVFVGYVNDVISVFVSVLPQPGGYVNNLFRFSRIVTLPDFQGLGLSNIMLEYIGDMYYDLGKRVSCVTTHPGMIRSMVKSKRWNMTSFDNTVKVNSSFDGNKLSDRLKASFIYIPNKYKKDIWE